jgi:hypothetical protein
MPRMGLMLVVRVEEAFCHCGKVIMRSGMRHLEKNGNPSKACPLMP